MTLLQSGHSSVLEYVNLTFILLSSYSHVYMYCIVSDYILKIQVCFLLLLVICPYGLHVHLLT